MDSIYKNCIKRGFDIFFSCIFLILFSVVLVIIAVLVAAKLGTPVIFKQQRPGKNEKLFTIYKFRTMNDSRDESGKLLSDEVRLPSFGRKLRSTSLDELPELLNILKGDMSFVGPRPLLVQYLPRYSAEQSRRNLVRPGLTGWAQVNGRNAISWEQKFEYDAWYVDNVTIWLDIKIITKTAFAIIKRDGISAKGEATMSEFFGTKK
jgi:undecaprenyl phosphate N,N'-diacetylbacillosamine 1-phosphate transferase